MNINHFQLIIRKVPRPRLELGTPAFSVLCSTDWAISAKEPTLRSALESGRWDSNSRPSPWQGDVLPLNYARVFDQLGRECRDPGSNWGHRDFQSRALPTELSRPNFIHLLSAGDFTRTYIYCQEIMREIVKVLEQKNIFLDFLYSVRYNV